MPERRRKLHFLITAGPTVEDIDPVRFLSNRSSGKLGFALASAAVDAGHSVCLIHGPVAETLTQDVSKRIKRIAVRSAAEMLAAVFRRVEAADIVIMNAAVADYTPLKVLKTKMKKSGAGLVLRLKATADILHALGKWKGKKAKPVLIGFALETGVGRSAKSRQRSAEAAAREKLRRKNLDLVVLNSPLTIGAECGEFLILGRDGAVGAAVKGNKAQMAKRLVEMVEASSRAI